MLTCKRKPIIRNENYHLFPSSENYIQNVSSFEIISALFLPVLKRPTLFLLPYKKTLTILKVLRGELLDRYKFNMLNYNTVSWTDHIDCTIYWSNCNINTFVIYPDFHSTKLALWLVDSWSRAPDQVQMYPDRDTIPQLLPAQDVLRRLLKEV